MEASKDYYQPAKLKATTHEEQYRRQRFNDGWEPLGFDRYSYQQALLRAMPVLGGPDDQYGANPDRYQPIEPAPSLESRTTKKR